MLVIIIQLRLTSWISQQFHGTIFIIVVVVGRGHDDGGGESSGMSGRIGTCGRRIHPIPNDYHT